jgi:hypothetical protein
MSVIRASRLQSTTRLNATTRQREYVERFLYILGAPSAPTDEAAAITQIVTDTGGSWTGGSWSAFPGLNSAHPTFTTYFLDQSDVEPFAKSNLTHWTVTHTYRTLDTSGGTSPSDTNPTARPPEIVWGARFETQVIDQDYTTPTPKKIRNTAGTLFGTPLEVPWAIPTLTYTRNDGASMAANVLSYIVNNMRPPSVNLGTFTIDGVAIPANAALLTIPTCQKLTEGGTTYYRTTYQFEFDPDTFAKAFGSYGFYELSGGSLKRITNNQGELIDEPWPLDGAGAKASTPDATPASITFQTHPKLSFAAFAFT